MSLAQDSFLDGDRRVRLSTNSKNNITFCPSTCLSPTRTPGPDNQFQKERRSDNKMDFSGMMSELQGVRELISCFVVAFYLAIVLILILPCLWIEGDDGCVK